MKRAFSETIKPNLVFVVTLAGSIASILSFAGLGFQRGDWKTQYIVYSSGVLIIAMLAGLSYMWYERLQVSRKTAQRYKGVFGFLQRISTELNKAILPLMRKARAPSENYDERFVRYVADTTVEAFTWLTGTTCAVSLKFFEGTEHLRIVTLARDTRSAPSRSSRDLESMYTIEGNTAFSSILKGGRGYFLENDLESLTSQGYYSDEDARWKDFYKSVLVVPIKVLSSQKVKSEIFGFLCIDSNETQVFDDVIAPNIATCIADMLCCYFENIDYFGSMDARLGQETEL